MRTHREEEPADEADEGDHVDDEGGLEGHPVPAARAGDGAGDVDLEGRQRLIERGAGGVEPVLEVGQHHGVVGDGEADPSDLFFGGDGVGVC